MLCTSPCDSNEKGTWSTMSAEYLLPFQMSLAMMKGIILLSCTPEKKIILKESPLFSLASQISLLLLVVIVNI